MLNHKAEVMSEHTRIIDELLDRIRSGDEDAKDHLYRMTYPELHRTAAFAVKADRNRSLIPSQIVNETYLRLTGKEGDFGNKRHFMAVAAKAMNHIVLDHLKHRNRIKHGGNYNHVPLADISIRIDDHVIEHVMLQEILQELTELDKTTASIVEMKLFTGLTIREIADQLGKSVRSVEREWTFARAWIANRVT